MLGIKHKATILIGYWILTLHAAVAIEYPLLSHQVVETEGAPVKYRNNPNYYLSNILVEPTDTLLAFYNTVFPDLASNEYVVQGNVTGIKPRTEELEHDLQIDNRYSPNYYKINSSTGSVERQLVRTPFDQILISWESDLFVESNTHFYFKARNKFEDETYLYSYNKTTDSLENITNINASYALGGFDSLLLCNNALYLKVWWQGEYNPVTERYDIPVESGLYTVTTGGFERVAFYQDNRLPYALHCDETKGSIILDYLPGGYQKFDLATKALSQFKTLPFDVFQVIVDENLWVYPKDNIIGGAITYFDLSSEALVTKPLPENVASGPYPVEAFNTLYIQSYNQQTDTLFYNQVLESGDVSSTQFSSSGTSLLSGSEYFDKVTNTEYRLALYQLYAKTNSTLSSRDISESDGSFSGTENVIGINDGKLLVFNYPPESSSFVPSEVTPILRVVDLESGIIVENNSLGDVHGIVQSYSTFPDYEEVDTYTYFGRVALKAVSLNANLPQDTRTYVIESEPDFAKAYPDLNSFSSSFRRDDGELIYNFIEGLYPSYTVPYIYTDTWHVTCDGEFAYKGYVFNVFSNLSGGSVQFGKCNLDSLEVESVSFNIATLSQVVRYGDSLYFGGRSADGTIGEEIWRFNMDTLQLSNAMQNVNGSDYLADGIGIYFLKVVGDYLTFDLSSCPTTGTCLTDAFFGAKFNTDGWLEDPVEYNLQGRTELDSGVRLKVSNTAVFDNTLVTISPFKPYWEAQPGPNRVKVNEVAIFDFSDGIAYTIAPLPEQEVNGIKYQWIPQEVINHRGNPVILAQGRPSVTEVNISTLERYQFEPRYYALFQYDFEQGSYSLYGVIPTDDLLGEPQHLRGISGEIYFTREDNGQGQQPNLYHLSSSRPYHAPWVDFSALPSGTELIRTAAGKPDYLKVVNNDTSQVTITLPVYSSFAWTAIIAESDAPSSGNAVINYNDEGVTITYTVNTAVEVDSLFLTLTDEYNNAVRLKIQIELSNIVKNDVDGDGKSDLLWRSYAKGWNFLWTMDGAFMSSATPINVVASNEWDMVGQGDYDADGKSDIFWRNNTSGQNFVYLMDGSSIKNRYSLNYVTGGDGSIIICICLN